MATQLTQVTFPNGDYIIGSTGDTKVTQTETTTNAEYEVTFAGSTGTTTTTEGVGKSEYFTFNPSKKAFTVGSRQSGSTVGNHSVAMGYNVTASGNYSYAEGYHTVATDAVSHAEGQSTSASGYNSHAEGYGTLASAECSHAEGGVTTASGNNSHSEGNRTVANHRCQHVFGEFNIADSSTAAATARGNYVEIVGNGTATNARSNARTLDWSGNEWLAGNLKVGVSTGDETTVMSGGISGTDHQTNAGTYFLSISGGGTGVPSLALHNQGSNANTVSVTASDITLGGTSNTWDGTNTSLKDAIANIIDLLHPVGSIYMSLTDSTVAAVEAKFGGTWEKIEDRFLLAASSSYTVDSTGGSANAVVVSHTHELAGTNAKAVDVSGHTHGLAGSGAKAVDVGGHTHTEYAGINEASSGLFTSITGTRSYPNTHIIGGAGKTSSNGGHGHTLTGNTTSAGGHGHSLTGSTKSTGESGTGKNMPPYLAVYMYKRTA